MAMSGLYFGMGGLQHFQADAFAGAAGSMIVQTGGKAHQATAGAVALVQSRRKGLAHRCVQWIEAQTGECAVEGVLGDVLRYALIRPRDKHRDSNKKYQQPAPKNDEIARDIPAVAHDRINRMTRTAHLEQTVERECTGGRRARIGHERPDGIDSAHG
jgi:hypothetical protein